jgi:hypothetical protein
VTSTTPPWKSGQHDAPTARRGLRSPRAIALLAVVGTGIAVPFVTAHADAASTAVGGGPAQTVYVSTNANRTGATALQGKALTGNSYIFVKASTRKVQFFLDKPTSAVPTRTETSAPYDLVGGSKATAVAFDTRALSEGTHTLITRVLDAKKRSVWSTVTTTFTVTRGGAAPVTPTTPPAQPTTPAPTTPAQPTTPAPTTPAEPTTPAPTTPAQPTNPSSPVTPVDQVPNFIYPTLTDKAAPVLLTGPTTSGVSRSPVATAALTYMRQPITGGMLPPAGFPGPSNTGITAGTKLTTVTGDYVVKTDGAVLEGLNILGCVDVRASNVTIRNTRVACQKDQGSIRLWDGETNLLVEDSEIDGLGLGRGTYADGGGLTLRRTNIHNVYDGPRVGSNSVIEDNWIHDLVRTGVSHDDAFQTTGATNVVIRHNSAQSYSFDVQDPHNSVMMLDTSVKPYLSNWTISDNYFDGGAVALNMNPKVQGLSNFVVQNNTFGPNIRHKQVSLGFARSGVNWVTTNIWAATAAVAKVF